MTDVVEVSTGAYYDSVSLMQVSREVQQTAGISAALVAMATELNLELMSGMGFAVPDGVSANDLVVAVRGEDQDAVEAGRATLEHSLAALNRAGAAAGGFGDVSPPRTIGQAISAAAANLAMISVPGPNAFVEAMDAVESGVSVMLFSDNVSVEQEVALKDVAARAGVLVMGPDCGTAVVAGVALGFANVVRRGPVGLVAASGTGAQQLMCLLEAAGVGLSHCLGVGGRDLSAAVQGRATRQALAALAADDETEMIVVVSKPPAPHVLSELRTYAGALGKPVHWAVLGEGEPDLTAATEAVLAAYGQDVPGWPSWPAGGESAVGSGALRGLFCGGTLAEEARLVARSLRSDDHDRFVDFGDDRLTQGRAHPMIDPSLRLRRIAQEATDPGCGVLLLDLVLGHGAHPDPAGGLADAVRAARSSAARELPVVVSLTGTRADPQGLDACAGTLAAAGASVFLSNAQAARHAVSLLAAEEG